MLKDVTLGQYFPGDSILHRIDPRMKLLISFMFITMIFGATTLFTLVVVAVLTFLLPIIAKISMKTMLKGIKPLRWVVIIMTLLFIINGALHIPIAGSIPLFLCGVALHLFAVTSLGIFLGCIAGNMPQLGMLLILVYLPMQMLSGSNTPQESMPIWVQRMMLAAPTTHFVDFSQSILFRGAGLNVVWEPFLWLIGIGGVLFIYSLACFRKSAA